MLRYLKVFFVSLVIIFSSTTIQAQADCILGVGGTPDSVLIDVFQLNTTQTNKLISYSEEVKYRRDILDNTLDNIRKRHPQSTISELSKLAIEYTVIIDSMTSIQAMMDKRLLSLFNEKQYNLYRVLCGEASRSPFIVAPTIYIDTTVVKKRASFLNNLDDKN